MDLNDPIDIDKDAESLIKNAQINFGYLLAKDLGEGTNNVFAGLAKQKMIGFGLITKEPINGIYYLTDKGWLFSSFKTEVRFYKRERSVKNNAYWRARFWIAFIIVGYVIGLITPILIEKLKSLFLKQ